MNSARRRQTDALSRGVVRAVQHDAIVTSPWGDPAAIAAMKAQLATHGLQGAVLLTHAHGVPYFRLDDSLLDGDAVLE